MAQSEETRVTLRVPSDLYKKLRFRTAAREESINQHIVDLIEMDTIDMDLQKTKDEISVRMFGGLDSWILFRIMDAIEVDTEDEMEDDRLPPLMPVDKCSERVKYLMRGLLLRYIKSVGSIGEWKKSNPFGRPVDPIKLEKAIDVLDIRDALTELEKDSAE